MKKLLLNIILLLLIFSQVISADKRDDISVLKVKELLKHASTYYWLARARDMNIFDFNRSKDYYREAFDLINSKLSEKSDNNLKTWRDLKKIAETGLKESEIRYANNFDIIQNMFPLYNVLTSNYKFIEFWDDPEVVAITNAMKSIKKSVIILKLEDFQVPLFVVSRPKNKNLEDEVQAFFQSSTHFFIYTDEIILKYIPSYNEDKLLTEDKYLVQLSEKLGKKNLCIFKIEENDIVNDVCYYGLTLYEWQKNNKSRSIYSDGFCIDRTDLGHGKLFYLIFGVLFLIGLFYVNIEKNIIRIEGSANKKNYLLALCGLAAGIIFFKLVPLSLGTIAPEPQKLAVVAWWWIFVCGLSIILIPVLLIVLFKIKKIGDFIEEEKLNVRVLYFEVLWGIWLSMLWGVNILYPDLVLKNLFWLHSLPVLFTATLIGIAVSYIFNEINKCSNYIYLVIGIAVFLLYYMFQIAPVRIDLPVVLVVSIISIILIKMIVKKGGIEQDKSKEDDDDIESTVSGMVHISDNEDLIKNIREPEYFDFIKKTVELTGNKIIDESGKRFYTLAIKGEEGTGKTRYCKELKKYLRKNFNDRLLVVHNEFTESSGNLEPHHYLKMILAGLITDSQLIQQASHDSKIASAASMIAQAGSAVIPFFDVIGGLITEEENQDLTNDSDYLSRIIIDKLTQTMEIYKNAPILIVFEDFQCADDSSIEVIKKISVKLSNSRNEYKNIIFVFISPDNNKLQNLQNEDKKQIIDDSIRIEKINNQQLGRFLLSSLSFDKETIRKIQGLLNKFLSGRKGAENKYQLRYIQEILLDFCNKNIFKFSKEADGISLVTIDKSNEELEDLIKIPEDISKAIIAKVSSLGNEYLKVLECAAQIGCNFNIEILARVLNLSRLELLKSYLEPLEHKHNLIKDDVKNDEYFTFLNHSVHRVLSDDIYRIKTDDIKGNQVLKEYNQLIYKAYDKLKKSPLTGEDLKNLSFHASKSGPKYYNAAFKYYARLAQHYYDKSILPETIKAAENAINLLERLQVIDDKSKVINVIKVYVRACNLNRNTDRLNIILDENGKKVFELFEKYNISDKYQVLGFKGLLLLFYYHSREYNKGIEYYNKNILPEYDERMRNDVPDLYYEIKFNYLSLLEGNMETVNKFKEFLADIKKYLEHNPDSKNRIVRKMMAISYSHCGTVTKRCINDGSLDKSKIETVIKMFNKSIEIKKELKDFPGLAISYGELGESYKINNNYEEAKKCYEKSIEYNKKIMNVKFIKIAEDKLKELSDRN